MTHGEPAFGRENHAIGDIGRSAGEPASDDLLRLTPAVYVGRIDQGAAHLDEAIKLFMGAGFVGFDAKRHGSQAERGYGATAAPESAIVHIPFLSPRSP